jgi:hypothetical protein
MPPATRARISTRPLSSELTALHLHTRHAPTASHQRAACPAHADQRARHAARIRPRSAPRTQTTHTRQHAHATRAHNYKFRRLPRCQQAAHEHSTNAHRLRAAHSCHRNTRTAPRERATHHMQRARPRERSRRPARARQHVHTQHARHITTSSSRDRCSAAHDARRTTHGHARPAHPRALATPIALTVCPASCYAHEFSLVSQRSALTARGLTVPLDQPACAVSPLAARLLAYSRAARHSHARRLARSTLPRRAPASRPTRSYTSFAPLAPPRAAPPAMPRPPRRTPNSKSKFDKLAPPRPDCWRTRRGGAGAAGLKYAQQPPSGRKKWGTRLRLDAVSQPAEASPQFNLGLSPPLPKYPTPTSSQEIAVRGLE